MQKWTPLPNARCLPMSCALAVVVVGLPRTRSGRGWRMRSAPSRARRCGNVTPPTSTSRAAIRNSSCAGASRRKISSIAFGAIAGIEQAFPQRRLGEHPIERASDRTRDRDVTGDHQVERQPGYLDEARRLVVVVVPETSAPTRSSVGCSHPPSTARRSTAGSATSPRAVFDAAHRPASSCWTNSEPCPQPVELLEILARERRTTRRARGAAAATRKRSMMSPPHSSAANESTSSRAISRSEAPARPTAARRERTS